MIFLHLYYLWLLLLLVPFFIYRHYKKINFVSYGYMLTFLFLVLSLSRPVIEQAPIKSEQILSDVIIAVDLSYSMSATDIQPSRLEFAKITLKKLVKSNTNTRHAVLGFTTNAIVLSPLTEDSDLLLHLYDGLDTNLIVTKGSSVMSALKLAAKMSKSKKPSLVILSDGADELSYVKEAEFAKKRGLLVNIFMIATSMGGTLVDEKGELVKDEMGDIVVSRQNDAIKIIANASGGVFTKDYDELLSALDSQKNSKYKTKTTLVQNREFFYYLVALAIVTFLVTVTTLKRYVLSFLLLLGISLEASSNNEYLSKAFKNYKDGEYDKALVNYESVRSSDGVFKSVVFYNIGTTYIRLKEFKKAKEAYLKSLTLHYSVEADENMRYIQEAEEQMQMNTGQEQTKKKSSYASEQKNSSKAKKDGGSSNMKVQAPASSGSTEFGEKTKGDGLISLKQSKTKLSSSQYELINKRGVNEKRPW